MNFEAAAFNASNSAPRVLILAFVAGVSAATATADVAVETAATESRSGGGKTMLDWVKSALNSK